MLRFDVFGRLVGVTREEGEWRAVYVGEDGAHRDAPAIVIPPWLEESDLRRFLADLFHESASPARPDVVFLGSADPDDQRVTLVPYSTSDHREHVRRWLSRPHVARWWGDPGDALHFIDHHATDGHALISIDGVAVGYICWQPIPLEEKTAACLSTLPEEHMDIDLFLGELEFIGRGVGTTALRLLIDQLQEEGVPSIGLAAATDNARAQRAYEKAGFRPFVDFVEDGQRMQYLCHSQNSNRASPEA